MVTALERPVTERSERYTFDLSGGRLCLDFTNTVGARGTGTPADHLTTYGDLLGWAVTAKALPARVARALARHAAIHPRRARQAVARARVLREALYRVFAASASRRPPRAPDLVLINRWLTRILRRSGLTHAHGMFRLDGGGGERGTDLTAMLTPVLRSTVDVLTSADAGRIRVCADRTCAWLFIDTTRNRTRRWCDMKVCGNRNKVRRFRARRS